MSDFFRQLLFPALVISIVASVWALAYNSSVQAQARQSFYPANDPALIERAFHADDTETPDQPVGPVTSALNGH